jgi:hypothetical protein
MATSEKESERTARHEFGKESDGLPLHAFGCNKETYASPGLAVYLHRKEDWVKELKRKVT